MTRTSLAKLETVLVAALAKLELKPFEFQSTLANPEDWLRRNADQFRYAEMQYRGQAHLFGILGSPGMAHL